VLVRRGAHCRAHGRGQEDPGLPACPDPRGGPASSSSPYRRCRSSRALVEGSATAALALLVVSYDHDHGDWRLASGDRGDFGIHDTPQLVLITDGPELVARSDQLRQLGRVARPLSAPGPRPQAQQGARGWSPSATGTHLHRRPAPLGLPLAAHCKPVVELARVHHDEPPPHVCGRLDNHPLRIAQPGRTDQ
jgi:hypothetical protein